ncbi:MAG TPA: hypothetical protein VI670_22600 [Thermoanaerobaculia bacterium]|jgi:hypothetical protein
MRESTIARFLAGEAAAAELAGEDYVGDLTEDVEVEPAKLLRFVDAVERGELSPERLAAIAKAIVDSDHLAYDDLVEAMLYEWSRSEIDLADSRRFLSGKLDRATWTRYILPALGAAALILAGLVWFVMTHSLMAWIPLALGFLLLVALEVRSGMV